MTIYDIAKKAGVSKSTVSRVIRHSGDVKEETKIKVLKIIKENNFVPNNNAQNTRIKKESYLILLTRLDSYSENRVVRGIIEYNDDKDFFLMETNFSIEKTKEIIEKYNYVNGIIIFAIGNVKYDFLKDYTVPIVFIGQDIKNYSSIVYEDYNSLYSLLEKVDKTREKKVIFIGFNENDPTRIKRYDACIDYYRKKIDKVDIEFDYLEVLKKLQNINLKKYNLFICATDSIALGVYRCIINQKIKDFKITGVGNNRQINFIIDNFSTIDLQYKRSGKDTLKYLKENTKKHIKTQYTIKDI